MDFNSLTISVALLALLVSGITAWATWLAPQMAAERAEQLRAASARVEARELLKRHVFLILMQERAAPYTMEAVRAFNSIDVAFSENTQVREAWAKYFRSQDAVHQIPLHQRQEYFADLLKKIAADLGLNDVRDSDFARVYAPGFIMRRLNIESMQQQLQERELEAFQNAASANTAPPQATRSPTDDPNRP